MSAGDQDNHWFREVNAGFWPGQAFSLEVDKILHEEKSKYQDVLVFKRYTVDPCVLRSFTRYF